jgi:cytochrome c553
LIREKEELQKSGRVQSGVNIKKEDWRMKIPIIGATLLTFIALPALAAEKTWRSDVQPIVTAKCAACHGAKAPEYNELKLLDKEQKT